MCLYILCMYCIYYEGYSCMKSLSLVFCIKSCNLICRYALLN